jgi:hypothetical protein
MSQHRAIGRILECLLLPWQSCAGRQCETGYVVSRPAECPHLTGFICSAVSDAVRFIQTYGFWDADTSSDFLLILTLIIPYIHIEERCIKLLPNVLAMTQRETSISRRQPALSSHGQSRHCCLRNLCVVNK